MKAPICEICLKNDILCSGCNAKLEEGKITPVDVEVSRKLVKLEEKIPSLKSVELKKVIETRNSYILVVKKGDAPKIIGKRGSVIKKISEVLGKDTRVIEETKNLEELLQNLVKPANIKGINILYTPEGEIYRVRIPATYRRLIHLSKNDIEVVATLATSRKVEVVFE